MADSQQLLKTKSSLSKDCAVMPIASRTIEDIVSTSSVIVPARSGSKRFKNKNIAMLGGKPLFIWSLEAANSIFPKQNIWFTTDSLEYRDLAVEYGFNNIIIRDSKLADDKTRNIELLSLFCQQQKFSSTDYFWLFQPTSPFRTNNFLKRCLLRASEISDGGTMASVTPSVVKRENWILNGEFPDLIPIQNTRNTSTHFLDAAIYTFSRTYLQKNPSFMTTDDTIFVQGDEYSSIDINTEWDFEFAKAKLNDFLTNTNQLKNETAINS